MRIKFIPGQRVTVTNPEPGRVSLAGKTGTVVALARYALGSAWVRMDEQIESGLRTPSKSVPWLASYVEDRDVFLDSIECTAIPGEFQAVESAPKEPEQAALF